MFILLYYFGIPFTTFRVTHSNLVIRLMYLSENQCHLYCTLYSFRNCDKLSCIVMRFPGKVSEVFGIVSFSHF